MIRARAEAVRSTNIAAADSKSGRLSANKNRKNRQHYSLIWKKGGRNMPELRCTVQTCTHNRDFYCDLNAIQVGGSSATRPEETCCDSFQERNADSYSNVTGDATPTNDIDCRAVECKYNDNCVCHAGKISVEGSNACQCEQTECATFSCR